MVFENLSDLVYLFVGDNRVPLFHDLIPVRDGCLVGPHDVLFVLHVTEIVRQLVSNDPVLAFLADDVGSILKYALAAGVAVILALLRLIILIL